MRGFVPALEEVPPPNLPRQRRHSHSVPLATLSARFSRLHDFLLLLVPLRSSLHVWCSTPRTICGGAGHGARTRSPADAIAGSDGGSTPRSSAMSTGSLID